MKTAIAINEPTVESNVERHFGKSPFFLIFDEHNDSIEIIPNPTVHDKGCKAASLVNKLSEYLVSRVVAGDFGSNVHQLFIKQKIQLIIHPDPDIRASDIIRLLKQKLSKCRD